MKNSNKGFTLIELLIVIAIIGILAAVLIPQLLGARIAANKRAVQAHSSTVYKAALAILGEDPTLSASTVATAVSGVCKSATPVTSILVSGTTYKYGWSTTPAPVLETGGSCSVAPNAADISVVVTGGPSADGVSSLNGQQPKAP